MKAMNLACLALVAIATGACGKPKPPAGPTPVAAVSPRCIGECAGTQTGSVFLTATVAVGRARA